MATPLAPFSAAVPQELGINSAELALLRLDALAENGEQMKCKFSADCRRIFPGALFRENRGARRPPRLPLLARRATS